MKELTKENLEDAVDKALYHIEIGPFELLDHYINASLQQEGVTREQMLRRWARSKPNPEPLGGGLAELHGPAANDDAGVHEIFLDKLAYGCKRLEQLKNVARVYAAGLLEYDRCKDAFETANVILQSVGISERNVEAAPVFAMRQKSKHLQQQFAANIQELVESVLPAHALKVGIERFESTVRDEFKEKTL